MSNKKYNVHLILEGSEEVCLFNIVKKYGVHENIELTFQDAGGYGNVPALYHGEMSNENHDCNLCVYDVDYRQKESDSPFNVVREQLLSVLGEQEMVDKISYCSNPNVLQILLLGADSVDKVKLMSGSKKTNTGIVHKYWDEIGRQKKNVKGKLETHYYDAREWQLKIISDSFEYGIYSYDTLLCNCSYLSKNYLALEPGSNLFELLKALKEGDIEYFENINAFVSDYD